MLGRSPIKRRQRSDMIIRVDRDIKHQIRRTITSSMCVNIHHLEMLLHMSRLIYSHYMRKPTICIMRNQRQQISFAVTSKLICAFGFATGIVQLLFFLNPKFPASSILFSCAARFVSDLLGNHIVGFLITRLIL